MISLVSPCNDGSLWVSSTVDSMVKHILPIGQNVNTLREIKAKVFCVAVNQLNDIFVSVDGPTVSVITSKYDNKVKNTSYNIKPFETTTIYMTGCGKVFVGGWVPRKSRKGRCVCI